MKNLILVAVISLVGCTNKKLEMYELQTVANCFCDDLTNVKVASYSISEDSVFVGCKDGAQLNLNRVNMIYNGECLRKK